MKAHSVNFIARIMVTACYLLFLTACTSPFKTKEVITCPIDGGEKGARFELISSKRKNYSPFSWHVSDYTVPTNFKVFFKREGLRGSTELPVYFVRSGTLEREKQLDYCETGGVIDSIYYFWHPIEVGDFFISLNKGESFTNVYPELMSKRESFMMKNGEEKRILWTEIKVLFNSSEDFLVEQAAHFRDSSCFLHQIRSVRCDPVQVRSTRTLDQGKTWTDPVIVDKPILFNLSSEH
ncbi:MAG: hypothetical protein H7A01_03585 [Hahellaceae bacterium]|nr:hypothetical protein [Hahellaceae bacterium]MCP5212272.1 hypothetical protein [Hahellaceae bacterium]